MTGVRRGGTLLLAGTLVGSLVSYAFNVLLARWLGPEQYGVFSVAQSLSLLPAVVIGAAYPPALAKLLAERGGEAGIGPLRRMALLWTTLVSVGLTAVILAAYVVGLLPLGAGYLPLLVAVAAGNVVIAWLVVERASAQGLFWYGVLTLSILGEVVVKSVAALGLVAAGLGALGALTGVALGYVAGAVVPFGFLLARRRGRAHAAPPATGRLHALAVPLFVTVLSTSILLQLDVLAIKLLSPRGEGDGLAGAFQAAAVLGRTPFFVVGAVVAALLPHVSRDEDRHEDVSRHVGEALRVTLALTIPLLAPLVVMPDATLALLFPPELRGASHALPLIVLGTEVIGVATLLAAVYQGSSRPGRGAAILGGALAVQLAAMAVLVPRDPLRGAAIATLLAGVGCIVILVASLRRTHRLRLALPWHAYALALAAACLAAWLVPHATPLQTLAALLAEGLAALAVLLALGGIRKEDVLDLMGRRASGSPPR